MTDPFRTETGRKSWGRVVEAEHQVARPRRTGAVRNLLRQAGDRGLTALAHGLGRSYGDSNLNPGGALIETGALDRFIALDVESRTLRAEAGVSFDDILRAIVPHGLFLPTLPGTRYVTLGGAIANDVHGKNHHSAGSFGRHVRSIRLERSDRGIHDITRDTDPELFAATIGGLGLTGVILEAEIGLVPIASAFIDQRTEPLTGVDQFFDIAEARAQEHEHTVAWVDCTASGDRLGQGVLSCGDWAEAGALTPHRSKAGPALPVDLPGFALNPITLKAFNLAYRKRQLMKPAQARVHYSGFFHPLDSIRDWNRLYGARGFYQYQSVIGFESAREATRAMLARIAASGLGSFLAVLKTFGDHAPEGVLSFPKQGATLALDFANTGERTLSLMADLDRIVAEAGGRLYPAKDGRMPAAMFRAGYPDWTRVEAMRDPLLSSQFWRRVTDD